MYATRATGDSHNIRGTSLRFHLCYEEEESLLHLSKMKTVRDLKEAISMRYGVPPSQQYIEGWNVKPSSDKVPLKDCSVAVNRLTITFVSEAQAALSFHEKATQDGTLPKGIDFLIDLDRALHESCYAPLPLGKILLLFLYKEHDQFSITFCKKLNEVQVKNVIQKFSVLAWDISDEKYHELLVKTLNLLQLQPLTIFIENQKSAAFCLRNVNGCVAIAACLYDDNSQQILEVLKDVENRSKSDNLSQLALGKTEKQKQNENDLNIKFFQQIMADRLSDRDYDRIEFNEREELYKKVGFALFGPPQNVDAEYAPEQKKVIAKLCRKIIDESNEVAEYRDLIDIAFIYNCIEPLPTEKVKRSEQFEDYNPNADFIPLPIFVLRKCRGSKNPCRVFIDHTGRVYFTWEDLIFNNKLHECIMHLPRNGRYEMDEKGDVLLETHSSPSCGTAAKVLTGFDYGIAGIALTSASVFIAAIFTPVLPVVLITAGAIGGATGTYGIGRSIHTLVDRGTHRESLSLANSEARGAYISIVAGALGFVGMGANILMQELIRSGVNINNGAISAIKTLGVLNISANGVSIINCGYDIIDGLTKNEAPSPLALIQLGSSILFFGNAVYNFNSFNTKIEESQKSTLQKLVDNLKGNRYQRIFSELITETTPNDGIRVDGAFEVIKGMTKMSFAIKDILDLFRGNENKLIEYGAKVTLEDGQLHLNGQPIDMDAFINMNRNRTSLYRGNLPIKSDGTPEDTVKMKTIFMQNNFNEDVEGLSEFSAKLVGSYHSDVQEMVVKSFTLLWGLLPDGVKTILDNLFNPVRKYALLFEMVFEYFVREAEKLEEQFQKWEETSDPQYYSHLFVLIDTDKKRRRWKMFEVVIRNSLRVLQMSVKDLLSYVLTWIVRKLFDHFTEKDKGRLRKEHSAEFPRKKVDCKSCNGYHYQ